MEATLERVSLDAVKRDARGKVTVYWIATALLCLEMGFTGYYMLFHLPEGAQAIVRLGFPDYFRVELGWAKLIGAVLLLAPAPRRLKEWAYAGYAINLVSAMIAHLSMGDGPQAVFPSAATSVLWALSYFLWRA